MDIATIEIAEGRIVQVRALDITSADLAVSLKAIAAEEQPDYVRRAVEVGHFALQRAGAGQDLEYLKRLLEASVARVEQDLVALPAQIEKSLLEKIGTGNGQVLEPIQRLVVEASRSTLGQLDSIRGVVDQTLDPTTDSSALGKALATLRVLLDPARRDSVQGTLEAALRRMTAMDGSLITTVKAVVAEAVKPLADEVDQLGREFRSREAGLEAIEQTTLKGVSYEEDVVEELSDWSRLCGAQIFHVGGDKKSGDILIKLSADSISGTNISLVIEARDHGSPNGRWVIAVDLANAMAQRQANVGLYLSRRPEGLAKEIGEWAEGENDFGPWVATTHQHLLTAIRFLMMSRRLLALRESRPEIDATAIEGSLGRIRTAIGRITNINRKVTEIRETANGVQNEAEALRTEIKGALLVIEDALRLISDDGSAGGQVGSTA
jgi:hypothetical protein